MYQDKPLIVQFADPVHPVSMHVMYESPMSVYPALQLNVAFSPKVVPPLVSTIPFAGAGFPQSKMDMYMYD